MRRSASFGGAPSGTKIAEPERENIGAPKLPRNAQLGLSLRLCDAWESELWRGSFWLVLAVLAGCGGRSTQSGDPNGSGNSGGETVPRHSECAIAN